MCVGVLYLQCCQLRRRLRQPPSPGASTRPKLDDGQGPKLLPEGEGGPARRAPLGGLLCPGRAKAGGSADTTTSTQRQAEMYGSFDPGSTDESGPEARARATDSDRQLRNSKSGPKPPCLRVYVDNAPTIRRPATRSSNRRRLSSTAPAARSLLRLRFARGEAVTRGATRTHTASRTDDLRT